MQNFCDFIGVFLECRVIGVNGYRDHKFSFGWWVILKAPHARLQALLRHRLAGIDCVDSSQPVQPSVLQGCIEKPTQRL